MVASHHRGRERPACKNRGKQGFGASPSSPTTSGAKAIDQALIELHVELSSAVEALGGSYTPQRGPRGHDGSRALLAARERPLNNGHDVAYTRAEAARILLTASSHAGVNAEDRAYLTRLVAARTGLGQPDAERRVDTAIARAKDNIARARRSTVILAFMAGAAALLGAAAAWFAAGVGGQHRDNNAPSVRWTALGPRVVVVTKP